MLYIPRAKQILWVQERGHYYYSPNPFVILMVIRSEISGLWYWGNGHIASFEFKPPQHFKTWHEAALACEKFNNVPDEQYTITELIEKKPFQGKPFPVESIVNSEM